MQVTVLNEESQLHLAVHQQRDQMQAILGARKAVAVVWRRQRRQQQQCLVNWYRARICERLEDQMRRIKSQDNQISAGENMRHTGDTTDQFCHMHTNNKTPAARNSLQAHHSCMIITIVPYPGWVQEHY